MSPFRLYRAAIATALLTASTWTVNSAWSQTYPSRPIQLIDGYAEGGTGYEVGRVLAEELTTSLGQPVTLVQRPGASGVIAAQSVVKAPPDGYTLLVGHPAEIAINQHLVKDLGYRPERDLQPVALAAEVPLALTVRADAPYNSVSELIKAAKSAKQACRLLRPEPERRRGLQRSCCDCERMRGCDTFCTKAPVRRCRISSRVASTCISREFLRSCPL